MSKKSPVKIIKGKGKGWGGIDLMEIIKVPGLHYCEIPKTAGKVEKHRYGLAVKVCYENTDGKLWVDNNEYNNQVNYCPFCGYKARIKIK